MRFVIEGTWRGYSSSQDLTRTICTRSQTFGRQHRIRVMSAKGKEKPKP
jgi:hypothetical protein